LPDYHNIVNDSITAPIAQVKAENATEMAQRSKSDNPMSAVNPAGVLPAGTNEPPKHPQAFPASAAGNSRRRPTQAAAFQLFPSLKLRRPTAA